MAEARAQIAAIQRQHRVQRRHGEEPSQTPTMSGLLRQQQPSEADDGLPPSAQRMPITEDDDDDSEVPQFQLPRIGRPPRRPAPAPPGSSSESRGRPRGRPRLGRMPVGRPTVSGRPRPAVAREPSPRREFDEPGPVHRR
jgi:hypothetical protein